MPKRSRSGVVNKPGARCGPHQRELGQINFHTARRRPLTNDQVQLEILHRRIKHFFNSRVQAGGFHR